MLAAAAGADSAGGADSAAEGGRRAAGRSGMDLAVLPAAGKELPSQAAVAVVVAAGDRGMGPADTLLVADTPSRTALLCVLMWQQVLVCW